MTPDDPRHGTNAGYQAHRNEGSVACPDCRAARSAYMREHRKTNQNWRPQNMARGRALWALAQAHPDEFRDLYAAELAHLRTERLLSNTT